jgi:uroporphyrinogen-III decarboxylase
MLKHSAARVNETRTTTTSGGRTTKILSAITAVITALGTNLPLAGTPGSPITTGR